MVNMMPWHRVLHYIFSMVKFSVVGTQATTGQSAPGFLSYKILYVWLREKVMTVICYTFTTSASPCFIWFPSSQAKLNIEHLVACWRSSWKFFYLIKLLRGVHWQCTELWWCGVVWCGVWTENIMINWTLPGVSKKPRIIWLKYFKWFTLYLNFSCFLHYHLTGKAASQLA